MPPFQPNQAFPTFAGNTLPYSSTTLKAQPKMPSLYDNVAKGMMSPQQQAGATLGGISNIKRAEQDNSAKRLSSAGEKSGVKFKHDNSGHATGQAAFDTLDAYMKSAGLNSFQANFFGRLISAGYNEPLIIATVKTASQRFGAEVAVELNEWLEKLAGRRKTEAKVNLLKGLWDAGRRYFTKKPAQQAARDVTRKAPIRPAPRPSGAPPKPKTPTAKPTPPATRPTPSPKPTSSTAKPAPATPPVIPPAPTKPSLVSRATDTVRNKVTQPLAQGAEQVKKKVQDSAQKYVIEPTKATTSAAVRATAPTIGRAATGGTAGAFAPTGDAYNEDGSINWGARGRNVLIGAGLTALPGLGSSTINRMNRTGHRGMRNLSQGLSSFGRRTNSGAFGGLAGQGLGGVGEMTGVLPEGSSDYGFLIGAGGGALGGPRVGATLDRANLIDRGIGTVGRAAANNPLATLGMTGTGVAGATAASIPAANSVADANIRADAAEAQRQELVDSLAPLFEDAQEPPTGQPPSGENLPVPGAVDDIAATQDTDSDGVPDSVETPETATVPAAAPVGPAEAAGAGTGAATGQGDPAAGSQGDPATQSDIMQQLLPYLLLGGLGAAGGYGYGGGGGATLGGIGLPLLYALATRGQQGNILDTYLGKDTDILTGLTELLGGSGGEKRDLPDIVSEPETTPTEPVGPVSPRNTQQPAAPEAPAPEAVAPEAPAPEAVAPEAAAPEAAAPEAAAPSVPPIPGDVDGDGQISAEEGAAFKDNPALIKEMLDHPQTATIAKQQYFSNPEFKENIDAIRDAYKDGYEIDTILDGKFGVKGVIAQTGLPREDARRLVELAINLR